MSPLTHLSSPVDWCEKNYQVNGQIAEFTNTISNIFFIIIPVIAVRLFWGYGRFITRGILLVWALFIVVGISSAYFHSTLSLLGQLLDELSILWVVACGFGLWMPKDKLPLWFHGSRKLFRDVVIGAAFFTTCLSGLLPAVNAFVLMLLLVPSCLLLVQQLKRCTAARVLRLGRLTTATLGLAVICWVLDRFFCSWSLINMHAMWHVLICLGSYMGCVLFALFEAIEAAPEQRPVLRFWPYNSSDIGIPYVFLETGHRVGEI